MGAGLQVFARDGRLVLDLTKSYSKFIGAFSTGVNDGSQHIPAFSQLGGQPFFAIVNMPAQWNVGAYPNIWIEGDFVRWAFGPSMDIHGTGWQRFAADVIVGVI